LGSSFSVFRSPSFSSKQVSKTRNKTYI